LPAAFGVVLPGAFGVDLAEVFAVGFAVDLVALVVAPAFVGEAAFVLEVALVVEVDLVVEPALVGVPTLAVRVAAVAGRRRGTLVRRPPTVPASTVAGCTSSGISWRAPAERARLTVSRWASQRSTRAA
jgi:hypothetical protein